MPELNPHSRRSATLATLIISIWSNRRLIHQLSKREVAARYRGSIAGFGWSLINPLVMLAVYTFVFSVVFQVRWGASTDSKGAFAVVLFVGIIVHGIVAECVNRAPTLIPSNAGYVKRVVFPLEILPVVAMGPALFHAAMSLIVLICANLYLTGSIPVTAIAFPLIILPMVIGTLGVSWFFSALGVYIRDVGQVTVILMTVLLFLSPAFYPIESLPEEYRKLLYLNPLTYVIEGARDVLLWGRWPHWPSIFWQTILSVVVAWLGYWSFQRMRPGFADVI